jgi:hypothetical protein
VPHQTTMRFSSRRNRRVCAVTACGQQSGTIALESQKATSVLVSIGANCGGCDLGRDATSTPSAPE